MTTKQVTAPDFADTLHVACRAAFEGWCAPGIVVTDRLDKMQIDLAAWQAVNFGRTGDLQMVAGIAEEVGEFYEATEARDEGAITDAYGDILVYLGQLLTSNRLAMRPILNMCRFDGRVNVSIPAGRLCHAVLKHAQGIRGMDAPDAYRRSIVLHAGELIATTRAAVDMVVHGRPMVPEEVYRMVGSVVLARDWQATRKQGLASPVAAP